MQASEIPFHWYIVEAIGVLSSFVMYHLLALRRREGWLVYVFSGFAIIYLMVMKDSWITVMNQCMMMVLGVKNYLVFGKPSAPKYAQYLDWVSLPVYVGSFFLVKSISVDSFIEIGMWGVIIAKTLTLGKGQLNGWKWQVAQQFMSLLFGWQRSIYLYMIKSALQLLQGIWGYWQWKKTADAV